MIVKRRPQILMLILACIFVMSGCSASDKSKTEQSSANATASEKIVLSDSLPISMNKPTLPNLVNISSLIITGQIVSIQEGKWTMESGTPVDDKISAMGYNLPEMAITRYQINITETILGDTKGERLIECIILGGLNDSVTKPHDLCKVLLIMNNLTDRVYVPVAMEHSIFLIDDHNLLYSYSNLPELSKYDSQTVDSLRIDINNLADLN